ncbi:MAG: FG-GAP repeat protein [Parvularculaceae bacterium]|nr:FG-GAP repeat protein [Parvularculaceae bacterium]
MAVNLSSLNGANGFEIRGEFASGHAGWSVAGGGDFNGDGFEDFIIGAPYANTGSPQDGATYLLYGTSAGFGATFDLSSLNASNGFRLNGVAGASMAGTSVDFAGDINNDGFADIIIGAPGANPGGTGSGAAYVIFGGTGSYGPSFELSSLNGATGFRIGGDLAADALGGAVAGAGDINGDGIDDFIVGAKYADASAGADTGKSYVVFGSTGAFSATFQASTLNGSNGFVINGAAIGDSSGQSVSSAGDVNGDGVSDLLIGASGLGGTGGAYVLFGKTTGFGAAVELSSINGTNGFQIVGEAAGDLSGYSATSIGDINGDGFDDIAIGAIGADPSGKSSAGKTYVIFGKNGGFGATVNLSALNGANGFIVHGGANQDELGISIASAGDMNGDGYDDLIIGAFFANPNGVSDAGQAYVIFGSKYGFLSTIDLAALKGWQGFALNGVGANDVAGSSVGAADINDDGFSDLLIGATRTDPPGLNGAGSTYVVFGGAAVGAGVATNGDDLIVGGAGADVLSGLNGADLMRGLNTGDTVNGGAGNDTIEGGEGSDRVIGGLGDDRIDAGNGNDTVDGGDGADFVLGLGGRDSILGGAGNDTVDSGSGNDTIDGGANNDSVYSASGDDSILGGNGNDILSGSIGLDTIDGGKGFDYILGGDDADSLSGGETADTLIGGVGNDTMRGGTENDLLIGQSGQDRIFGDDGDDVVDGGGGGDSVEGGNGADSLNGGVGFDTMIGGAGNDTLIGGADNDVFTFQLGAGTDTIRDFAAGAAVADTIRLVGFGASFDTFGEVLAAATDNGVNTTINFGNGVVIVLEGVLVSQLNANDFAFG